MYIVDSGNANELQDLESQYGPVMAQYIFDQLKIVKEGEPKAQSAQSFEPTRSLDHKFVKAA